MIFRKIILLDHEFIVISWLTGTIQYDLFYDYCKLITKKRS